MKTQSFYVIGQKKENLIDNGKCWATGLDAAKSQYDSSIVVIADLPSDFSVETYTIENGQLVKASEEVIAERQQLKLLAQREAIRTERQHRYDSEAISSLYWNWVESSDEADKQLWINAKNQVRQELPYPTERLADINKTIKNH